MKTGSTFLFLMLFFVAGIAAAETTLYYAEDFEKDDPVSRTAGTRTDERAAGGIYSLKSNPGQYHVATVTRGEAFFHVAGDLKKTRICFAIYSPKGTSWGINFVNVTLGANMQTWGKVKPGEWNRITLTLDDFKGGKEKQKCKAGDILHTFSLVTGAEFFIDDIRMETDATLEERNAVLPRRIVNKVDTSKATAQFELTVVDMAKGKPAPARVIIMGASEVFPDGGLTYRVGGKPLFFHTPGVSQLNAIPGAYTIVVNKGLEYRVVTKKIQLKPGANPGVKIQLEKWIDLDRRGFFCGDAHIHGNYGGATYVIQPEDVMLMARGEDVNAINTMVANTGAASIYDYQYFNGKIHEISDDEHILYYNEEYRSHAYGHLCLWRLRDLVFPVHNGFGAAGTPGHLDYPPNATILRIVRGQKGVVSYAHPFSGGTTIEEAFQRTFTTRELPIDAALMGLDAMDIITRNYSPDLVAFWWRLLNCNLKIPASAGTDAMPSGGRSMMGMSRVFVKVGGEMDYNRWIEQYKAGRTFVSTGPFVWMTVNGKEPGAVLETEEERLKLRIKVEAGSQFGLKELKIISMGIPVHTVALNGAKAHNLEFDLEVKANAWVTAEVLGTNPWPHHEAFGHGLQYATTGAVYCDLGRLDPAIAEDAAYFVKWVDLLKAYLEKRNRYGGDDNRREIHDLLDRAQTYYRDLEEKASGSLE